MFNIQNKEFLQSIENFEDALKKDLSSEALRSLMDKMHSRLRSFIGRKILWQTVSGKWIPSVIANILPVIDKGKTKLVIQLKSQWNGIWVPEDKIKL